MPETFIAFWYRSDSSGIIAQGADEETLRQKAERWVNDQNDLLSFLNADDPYDYVVEGSTEVDAAALAAIYGNKLPSEETEHEMEVVG
jgi:hypothetical protein